VGGVAAGLSLAVFRFATEVTAVIVKIMNQATYARASVAFFVLGAFIAAGCEGESRGRPGLATQGQAKQAEAKQVSGDAVQQPVQAVEAKKTELGKNVWLETRGKKRRVIVGATICLRQGDFGLECLLCRENTKTHESILMTDADAGIIHAALLAAGAEPGKPARYDEDKREMVPPSGMRIKVLLQYEEKGKLHTVRAQEWVLNTATKKELEARWVFAGSQLFPDPGDKDKQVYGANADGGYIYIYNSPMALLDLPISNPNKDPQQVGREFQPYTERIPDLRTKVSIILEPEPETKKGK